jgi:hypothetical protein
MLEIGCKFNFQFLTSNVHHWDYFASLAMTAAKKSAGFTLADFLFD